MSPRRAPGVLLAALATGACGPSEPLSYTSLVAGRLRADLPGAVVEVDGRDLRVRHAGRETRVDIGAIELLCRRGPRDCERAVGDATLAARDGMQAGAR